MVVEDNTLESNLIASQNIDTKIVELGEKLQVAVVKLYEIRNGLNTENEITRDCFMSL